MFEIFAYAERMKYIRRWSLMHALRDETDTEHSFQVAYIAHALALIENHIFEGKINTETVLSAALYHDLSETVTGDMPTPVKYYRPEMREIYGALEENTKERLLMTLPTALREAYAPIIKANEDTEEHRIVKAADRLSAYIKCLEEVKCGNTEFKRAMEGKQAELCASPLACVHYFMENVLPVYTRSLDELELPAYRKD